jgi:hypothetical protein
MSSGAEADCAGAVRRNAAALDRELDWLDQVLRARLRKRFGESEDDPLAAPAPAPDPASELGLLIGGQDLKPWERLVLILALAPHLRPSLLDPLLVRDPQLDRGFTDFGGWKGRAHGGFLPTGETAAFLLADGSLSARASVREMFGRDRPLFREHLVRIEHEAPGEPFLSGAMVATDEAVARLTRGEVLRPEFSVAFPARLATTLLDWDDLVLDAEALEEIETIRGWMTHSRAILDDWGLERVLKPGYRSLFYGPPGTGKTLTATLLGKSVGKDVYRIDLSQVVSKYIGETEKNLAQVFDRAEHGGWILFFDEADALFGRRTATTNSNDRYANQEVSYLLQRVEDFPGHVVLASNLKANIDEAFARRFQSMVYFPMPDAGQRLRLWRTALRDPGRIGPDLSLPYLAERHELSGGAITNVVRYAAIKAVRAGRGVIAASDIEQGVVKELRKEGRTV